MTRIIKPGSYLVTVKTVSTYLVRDLTQDEIDEHGETDEGLLLWAINEDPEIQEEEITAVLDWESVDNDSEAVYI